MIFQQMHEIVCGDKWQTRRLVKPGQVAWVADYAIDRPGREGVPTYWWVGTALGTPLYVVSRSVAVQPGRGMAALAVGGVVVRRQIETIWRERVSDITEDDAIAEGFALDLERGYYTSALPGVYFGTARDGYRHLWEGIHGKAGTRWADAPDVWAIEFAPVSAGDEDDV